MSEKPITRFEAAANKYQKTVQEIEKANFDLVK